MWITEGQFSWTGNLRKNNILKVGVFYHQHCIENEDFNSQIEEQITQDYGVYLVGDHQVFSDINKNRELRIFYQLGVSPRNDNFGYIGAGCAYSGLLNAKGTDVLGLAFANGRMSNDCGPDETTFELSYKVQLTPQIYLQPDLQYVVNPGGADIHLKNATVGLIRLGLEL